MTFKQLIQLLPKVVRYNLKIIFAGKFFPIYFGAYGHHAPAQYCGQIADTFAGGPDHLCDRQQTGRTE